MFECTWFLFLLVGYSWNARAATNCTFLEVKYNGYVRTNNQIKSHEQQVYCLSLDNESQFLYFLGYSRANIKLESITTGYTHLPHIDNQKRQYIVVEPSILQATEECPSFPCNYTLTITHSASTTQTIRVRYWKGDMLVPGTKYSDELVQYDRRRYGYRMDDNSLPLYVKMTPDQSHKKMDVDLYGYTDDAGSSFFYPNTNDRNYNKNYPEYVFINSKSLYYKPNAFYMFEACAAAESDFNLNDYTIQVKTNYHWGWFGKSTSIFVQVIIIFLGVMVGTFSLAVFSSIVWTQRSRILFCLRLRSTPHPNGASNRQIRRLSTSIYSDLTVENENDNMCIICLSEYESTDRVCILRCDHIYHKHCVVEWLRIQKHCPLCQQDIETATNLQARSLSSIGSSERIDPGDIEMNAIGVSVDTVSEIVSESEIIQESTLTDDHRKPLLKAMSDAAKSHSIVNSPKLCIVDKPETTEQEK